MSVRHSPAAPTLTMTSSGFSIFGSSTSSTLRLSAGMLSSYSCNRAAFTDPPLLCRYHSLPTMISASPDSQALEPSSVSGESQPPLRYTLRPKQADVAQLVEQLTRNEQVSGSSPLVGSLFCLQTRKKEKPRPDHWGLCQQCVSSRLSRTLVPCVGVLQEFAGGTAGGVGESSDINRLTNVPAFRWVRHRRR